MEIAILACCIVIIVLLVVILIRIGGRNDNSADILKNSIESGDRSILDQLSRQNDSVSGMIERHVGLLGDKLGSEQSSMKSSVTESLEKLLAEMSGLRKETREGIDSINKIVTEKMQTTLGESSTSMVRSISELGRNVSAEQEKSHHDGAVNCARNCSFKHITPSRTDGFFVRTRLSPCRIPPRQSPATKRR